jgi:hypothetical protein
MTTHLHGKYWPQGLRPAPAWNGAVLSRSLVHAGDDVTPYHVESALQPAETLGIAVGNAS